MDADEFVLDTRVVRDFVAEVKTAIQTAVSPEDAITAIRPRFSELLADPEWLPQPYAEAAPESGMGGGIGHSTSQSDASWRPETSTR